jgi:hypothetical protein
MVDDDSNQRGRKGDEDEDMLIIRVHFPLAVSDVLEDLLSHIYI